RLVRGHIRILWIKVLLTFRTFRGLCVPLTASAREATKSSLDGRARLPLRDPRLRSVTPWGYPPLPRRTGSANLSTPHQTAVSTSLFARRRVKRDNSSSPPPTTHVRRSLDRRRYFADVPQPTRACSLEHRRCRRCRRGRAGSHPCFALARERFR